MTTVGMTVSPVIPRRMVLNMMALSTVAFNTMVLITSHARYNVKG